MFFWVETVVNGLFILLDLLKWLPTTHMTTENSIRCMVNLGYINTKLSTVRLNLIYSFFEEMFVCLFSTEKKSKFLEQNENTTDRHFISTAQITALCGKALRFDFNGKFVALAFKIDSV